MAAFGLSQCGARGLLKANAMKIITAKDLDEKFDNGEDVSEYLDWSSAWRGNAPPTILNLEPETVHELDLEAQRLGMTRQSLVNLWITERLRAGRETK